MVTRWMESRATTHSSDGVGFAVFMYKSVGGGGEKVVHLSGVLDAFDLQRLFQLLDPPTARSWCISALLRPFPGVAALPLCPNRVTEILSGVLKLHF